jgi:hypothetical protein
MQTFTIYRFDPDTPGAKPAYQDYEVNLDECGPMVRATSPRAGAGPRHECRDHRCMLLNAALVTGCADPGRLDQDQERGRHDAHLPPLLPRGHLWLMCDEHRRCAARLRMHGRSCAPARLRDTHPARWSTCAGTNGLACLTRIAEGAPMKIYPLPRKQPNGLSAAGSPHPDQRSPCSHMRWC